MKRFVVASIVALLSSLGAASESRAGVVWASGHGDLAVHLEGGSLHMGMHFHEEAYDSSGNEIPEGEYEAEDVAIFVDGPALSRPAGTQWDFTGAAEGESLWVLSKVLDPSRPFLGWSTEELVASDWQDGVMTLSLVGIVTGPVGGLFSVWDVDGFGSPQVKASSVSGQPTSFNLSIPTHSHFNVGFTQAGTYAIELKASGVYVAGGGAVPMESSAVFTFHVGSIPDPVPEPASMAVFGLLVGGLGVRAYRRRG